MYTKQAQFYDETNNNSYSANIINLVLRIRQPTDKQPLTSQHQENVVTLNLFTMSLTYQKNQLTFYVMQ